MIHRLTLAVSDGDGMINLGVPEMEPWAMEKLEESLGIPLYPVG